MEYLNFSGVAVGGIIHNATSTSFVTTSDTRLKHAVKALTGALDVIATLNPVAFKWKSDDSDGHGFLADELQQVVPEAVTGEPDAVNEDGRRAATRR